MAGNAHWFKCNQNQIKRCVDLVASTCKHHYPDLRIPLHSRWRHFVVKNTNLWEHYTQSFKGDKLALARSAVDLIFLSVLVDAGAGEKWVYQEPVTGETLNRSEGLAAASMDLFFNHVANFDANQGWWIDANGLESLSTRSLGKVFQHSPNNPLLGLEGRLGLLHGLGHVLENESLKETGFVRPGAIIDFCMNQSKFKLLGKREVDITDVLQIVLQKFNQMWPSGFKHEGLNLGDCGLHSGLVSEFGSNDKTAGIIPFHKLSQWLTYSLVEPLQWAGLNVVNLDGLTGLPEYRNGGLFIDTGVLQPFDQDLLSSTLRIDSEAVVEWRALTVFMLDKLAEELRSSLKLKAHQLPLGAVLQGGSWVAGRELAAKLRKDSVPPIKLNIDGTIF